MSRPPVSREHGTVRGYGQHRWPAEAAPWKPSTPREAAVWRAHQDGALELGAGGVVRPAGMPRLRKAS